MIDIITFKREFGLILVGAIVFTASFLWKDLIVDIEEIYFPKEYGIGSRIFYTLIITVILVLIVIWIKDAWKLNKAVVFDDTPESEPGEAT